MGWDDDRARKEFAWLSLMSRMKYDGYHDFLAGVRFIESLASWMQQFQLPEERERAYAFLRQVLVYVGPAEMLRLVESLYPNHVQRQLVHAVADAKNIAPYRVWAVREGAEAYDELLRRTIFIGLSEGARLDLFRRANAGVVSNEQVLLATYADEEKWDKVLADLRSDLNDPSAKFAVVYLIDDFVGSGTTFIRKDSKSGAWKGKLASFHSTVSEHVESYFDPNFIVCVHHYLATDQAALVLSERHGAALREMGESKWFRTVKFSYGCVLPAAFPIDKSSVPAATEFIALAKKYFDSEDPSVRNRHTDEGGTQDVALGFAGCALPLVLDHNTPNNSVALLWAETSGGADKESGDRRHAMRPLFRRRQRHSG